MGGKKRKGCSIYYLNSPSDREIIDSELEIVEPSIHVHRELVNVCETIQLMHDGFEFSILAKGEWNAEGFWIGAEYYVPMQHVGMASVDYDEDLGARKNDGFNVVVHSHGGISKFASFSRDDEDYINSNFECSLLYSQGDIVDANMRLPMAGGKYLKLCDKNIIVKIWEEPLEEVTGIDRIKRKKEKRWAVHRKIKRRNFSCWADDDEDDDILPTLKRRFGEERDKPNDYSDLDKKDGDTKQEDINERKDWWKDSAT